jgi:diguanylate cyclase (GGDEF)-like protein
MVSQTTLIVLGGCVLGAIQLVAGVALGIWIYRSRTNKPDAGSEEIQQARLIAERLKVLADQMSSSAQAHRGQLDQASQYLQSNESAGGASLAENVVHVIGDIVRANQDLQSQLETAENRLEDQAVEIEAHISRSLTDPLTGLPNRREFNDRLEERMSAWKRRNEVFSLLMLDVDHFKALNDQHGHLAGDQVLATIARVLRGAVRREDIVARFGGEEFAILLPNTSLEQAMLVAEKVREAVANSVVTHNDKAILVTASGGLAAIDVNDTPQSLIQKADAALYAAKASGRNRTCAENGSDATFVSSPSKLAELVRAEHAGVSDEASSAIEASDFGAYLQRAAVSAQLAQTCEELRRFVEGHCNLQSAGSDAAS